MTNQPKNDEIEVNLEISQQSENIELDKSNTILFYEDIDDVSALQLNRLLLSVDKKLTKKYLKEKQIAKKYKGTLDKPVINLRLQSQGGDVFAAFSIIDVMSQLHSKVNTYIDGCAASGAGLIAIHGAKRYIGKNSFLLLHQLRGTQSGKYEDMQDEIRNSEKIMAVVRRMVKDCSNIDTKEVDELLKHEWWLTADECIKYNLVDKII